MVMVPMPGLGGMYPDDRESDQNDDSTHIDFPLFHSRRPQIVPADTGFLATVPAGSGDLKPVQSPELVPRK
jgi:hypothetical protein